MLRSLAMAMLVSLSAAVHAADRPLVLSTLPFDDAPQQQAIYGQLASELGRALGRKVVFEPGTTYADVVLRLNRGTTDVAFVGALSYVEARRNGNVRAILRSIRHKSSTVAGVLVVPATSSAKSLGDLRGKRIAFVDPGSTTGFFLPRIALQRAGLVIDRDVTAVFTGSHQAALKAMQDGRADAAAVYEGAETNLADPASVRVLVRTDTVPGDPVVVRAGLGPDVIKALRSAFMALGESTPGKRFLAVSELDGFVPALDGDYDGFAKLTTSAP